MTHGTAAPSRGQEPIIRFGCDCCGVTFTVHPSGCTDCPRCGAPDATHELAGEHPADGVGATDPIVGRLLERVDRLEASIVALRAELARGIRTEHLEVVDRRGRVWIRTEVSDTHAELRVLHPDAALGVAAVLGVHHETIGGVAYVSVNAADELLGSLEATCVWSAADEDEAWVPATGSRPDRARAELTLDAITCTGADRRIIDRTEHADLTPNGMTTRVQQRDPVGR